MCKYTLMYNSVECTVYHVDQCILWYSHMQALFTQYQFGTCPALPAYQLRDALAQTFADQQRYQLGFMDDAAECFVSTYFCEICSW